MFVPPNVSQRSSALAVALLALVPAAAPAQLGSVTGVVHDSIEGGPLGNAAVFLWNTPHRAETDAEGRFRIDAVPPGSYSILFFHPRLGELGVSPGPRPVSVVSGAVEEVELATPSLRTIVESQCMAEGRPEGSGAIAGRVYDAASELALGGAFVELSWEEEGQAVPETLGLDTGPDGRFLTCAAPGDVPVLVSATYYDRRNSRAEITVPEGGFASLDLGLHDMQPARVHGHLVDDADREPVEGAEAWLRGTPFRALSDGDGNFSFDAVPAGTYMLMADHIAYGTKMDTLRVGSGQELSIQMYLSNRPIEIAPIVVTAEAGRSEIARRRGGIVISRSDIAKLTQRSRDASDILRSLQIPGVIVRHNSNGTICVGFSTGQVRLLQTDCDEMLIYINDVRATNADMALRIPPDAIERMVVYKPLEAGNLFGAGGGNGVWVIYTRGN